MEYLRSQISLQMNRFLMIQNAAVDAAEEVPDTRSRHLVNTRLEVLETNWAKSQVEHEKICHTRIEGILDESYVKHRTYERCQEFYVQARALLLEQQDSIEASNSGSRLSDLVTPETRQSNSRRSLPKISLPAFAGDYHSWRSFHDLFVSMIVDNHDLTNVERMHYLKTCLSGDAARLVTNLKVTDNTFSIAWKTLTARYENKRVLISAQLDKLFALKPIKSKSAQQLNTMIATVRESLGALEALDCSTSTWDSFMVYYLARLLDEDTREAWEVKLGPSTSYPALKEFEEFVIGHTRAWESMAITLVKPIKERGRFSGLSSKSDVKSRSLVASTSLVKGELTCRLCMHSVNKCTSSRDCKKCGKRHHTTIHDENKISTKSETKTTSDSSVNVKVRDGQFISVRALLDPGSELSFITEELVNLLKLPRSHAAIPLLGIGGTDSGRTGGSVFVILHSKIDNSVAYKLHAFVLHRLTFQLPSFVVANEAWAHFFYLELADPNFGKPGPIHVIIGADSYGQILKAELLKSNSSPLIAQSTLFGWVISGPVTSNTDDHNGRVYHCTIDRDLQDLLARFWKQEEIPESNAKGLSNEEDNCEKHFLSTFSRDQSGRYMVRLPLKSPATLLGDSSSTALRCLSRLNQKFEKQLSFCELYKNFLQEYLTLGHMTPAVEPEVRDNPMVYLPHHGVLRDDSPTTKLRVVFNGSSPTSSGVSLNDILYSGAKLQSDLSDVLLWFRSHKYVFSSDITKMYRQILIHPSDHNLQRIFWYDSQNQLCSYCLTTVTYGLSCAPFLALRVIQQLIIDEGHRFPKAIPSLVRGRYVDDIFGGAESIDKTKEIIIQVTQLCNAGGFPLQKWHSNCTDLLVNMSTTQILPLRSS
ncbi:PREDICTED: uncharacterized protein LOC108770514 [Trachymyrmex cornetzi]|uniref:uncharacterized protein LOC108770514 n=1 Tax=Trachymyrmex cornetzi TaxID=471704 RepID=UPI00084F5757|nr:PREDICTED: uncharacterized protein LOC108770514 [Trachymyrmex cornetzi]